MGAGLTPSFHMWAAEIQVAQPPNLWRGRCQTISNYRTVHILRALSSLENSVEAYSWMLEGLQGRAKPRLVRSKSLKNHTEYRIVTPLLLTTFHTHMSHVCTCATGFISQTILRTLVHQPSAQNTYLVQRAECLQKHHKQGRRKPTHEISSQSKNQKRHQKPYQKLQISKPFWIPGMSSPCDPAWHRQGLSCPHGIHVHWCRFGSFLALILLQICHPLERTLHQFPSYWGRLRLFF